MPPHHHRAPDHLHEWFYNAEQETQPAVFARILRRMAEELMTSGSVRLGAIEVKLPERITGIVRHERTPHGTLALKLEAEWSERSTQSAETSSLNELID